MNEVHPKNLSIKDFTYKLPEEKIAKYPLPKRDESRLLVYKSGNIEESQYMLAKQDRTAQEDGHSDGCQNNQAMHLDIF